MAALENTESKLLTIVQLVAKLGCNRRAVQRLVEGRKIPVIRMNRRLARLRWRDVEAEEARTKKASVLLPTERFSGVACTARSSAHRMRLRPLKSEPSI